MSEEQAAVPEALAPSGQDVNLDEVVAHQQQADVSEQAEAPAPVEDQVQKDKDYNWRQMRSAMEELQRSNQDLRTQLQSNAPTPEPEIDELDQMADDDILTKAQAARLVEKKAYTLAKKAARELFKERELDTLDDRVKAKYPDYNNVVTQENLEELKRDPLFVKSLKGLEDPWDQASYVYEQLKIRGVTPQAVREKQQLENNASKPRSTQSLGGPSPLHAADQYSMWPDPKLKEQLYKEMTQAAKGA